LAGLDFPVRDNKVTLKSDEKSKGELRNRGDVPAWTIGDRNSEAGRAPDV
jgi:hypothetical protein